MTLPGAVNTPTYSYKPSDQSRQTWAAAAEALELETINRGLRNVTLFDAVRFWAYSVPRGDELEAWTRRVRVYALEQNRRFPQPLDGLEVIRTAYSISTWCWSGGGARWHFDHSSATQRRRGIKSGKVRRARNTERDAAILSDLAAGMGVRAAARTWGLAHSQVQHVRDRVAYEPNQSLVGVGRGKGEERGLFDTEGEARNP